MNDFLSSLPQLPTSELAENEEVDLASSYAFKVGLRANPVVRGEYTSMPELRDLHRKNIYPKVDPFSYGPEKPKPIVPPPIIDFSKFPITRLNEPRKEKRLLVFEIEHILCHIMGYPDYDDPKIVRPHYDEMFKNLYKHYDIILWSVNGPVQMRVMLRQLKVLEDKNFKVLCCMNSSHLFIHDIPNIGFKAVKPLEIIWHHFPQYNDTNTILIDYNEYHMYFNRRNGMKIIKYFRHNRTADIDLRRVKSFLLWVASNSRRNVTKYRFHDYVGFY